MDVSGSGFFRNLSDVFREAISTGQIRSLYQGLGTKNLQSFISQFVYFYGYSYFKRLYLVKSGSKSIGTTANLVIAAAAGACTAIVTQVSIFGSLYVPQLAIYSNNERLTPIFPKITNCSGSVYNCPVNELYDISRCGTVDLKTQNLEFPCIGLSTNSVSLESCLNDVHGIFYVGEV